MHKIRVLGLMGSLLLLLQGSLSGQSSLLWPLPGEEYQRALDLYQAEQYGNAQHLFDQLREQSALGREQQLLAQYYGAHCAIALYQGDAQQRMEAFAERYSTHPLRHQLFLAYAQGQFSLKRYRPAAEYYARVESASLSAEDLAEYQFKYAYALLQVERAEEALPLFFRLKNGSSAYAASSRYYYAHLLYLDSNYAAALSNFLPLQEDPIFGPLVPYYLAHIYYALEDYDQLVAVGEELVATATESRAPEIAKLLADAFYNKGDYANSGRYLALYREKGGQFSLQDHYQAGYVAYRQKDYASAIASFNKITRGPEALRQNTYYHLADSYLQQGDKNRALNAFSAASALSADPKLQEDAYYQHAKLSYELASPFKDALSSLLDFQSRYPQSPHRKEIDAYIANVYITTRDYPRALEAIKKVGFDQPKMREAYQRLRFLQAAESFKAGQYAAALAQYQDVLQQRGRPDISALSQYWIGECHYQLRDYVAALKAYRAFRNSGSAGQGPEFVRSFYASGYAAYKEFDFQSAAADFRAFVRQAQGQKQWQGESRDAYLRLGDSYLLTGGYLVAADFYEQALKAGTEQADYALYQRAECMGLAGKDQDKVALLQKLQSDYPGSEYAEDAAFDVGLVYLQMDRYEPALTAFSRFQQKYPQSERWLEAELKRGLIFSNADREAEAISLYRRLVRDHPSSQEAREAVALAEISYKRQNRMDDYLDWVQGLDFVDIAQSSLDSTAYQAAFDLYAQGQYPQAQASFASYLKRFDRPLFVENALYYAAQSAVQSADSAAAYRFYQALSQRPQHQHSWSALRFLAQADYRAERYADARDYFFRLQLSARRPGDRHWAELGLLRCAVALGDYPGVQQQARIILTDSSFEASAQTEARRARAASYWEEEKWTYALGDYRRLQSSARGEGKAEAFLREAQILQRLTHYDSSNTVINRMIEELPSYKEYKMRGLVVMAGNFWKMDDIFQANYILDFVRDSDAEADIKSDAKALREDIQRGEAQALEAKSRLMREQNSPIQLDTEKGLQIIDAAPSDTSELEALPPQDPQEDDDQN